MATLDDVALSCAKQLSRVDSAGTTITDLETEIKEEIGNAIKYYNRRASHLTEFRGFELDTVAGTVWYSTIDMTNGDGDQDTTGRTAVNVNTILSIDYGKKSTGTDIPLDRIPYRTFEQLREGTTAQSIPTYFTIFAGQIGIWPAPDAVYTLYFSGDVKPVVPTTGSDTSIWFDEAQEMIEAAACGRICLKYLRDAKRAAEFGAMENIAYQSFHHEYVKKASSGKLRVHD